MHKRWISLLGFVLLAAGAGASFGQSATENQPAKLNDARTYAAVLVGHAHIDLAWLWRWEDTVRQIAVQTFGGTLAQMAKVPGLTFAQSQAALYEVMEKDDPAIFEAISRRIKDGTWIPVGGMWCEPDLNMPDGEALARQLLYGKRYFLDKFGVDVTVGWNPDSFGHNWQLPQIYRRAGITSYVFGRCAPDKTPYFRWQGKDGSRVFAYVPQGWYNVGLQDGLAGIFKEAASGSPLKEFMILYGAGDHGGGPRDSDVAAINRFRLDPAQPKMVFGNPVTFLKKVEASGVDFPLVNRELNFTFPACYTTQVEEKKWNRASESLLLQAERISALAVAAGWRDYYPDLDIDEAWKTVLRNQFHDILDGSAIGPAYDEAIRYYKEAAARGNRALDFSLETILSAVDTRGEGLPVVVFNPLFWPRTEAVTAEAALPGSPLSVGIVDASGSRVPVQILGRTPEAGRTRFRVVFVAKDVPSFGYKVYRALAAEKSEAPRPGLTATTSSLENEFFRVEFDKASGWISSLYDKRSKREVFSGPANVLQSIVDEPESMSAWELGLKGEALAIGAGGASLDLIEAGPVRAVLRVTTPFRNSIFQQDLTLYNGIPRLDCRLHSEWQERNLMIKVAFPVNGQADKAEFEIPFGSITRPADGTEVPALRWIDVSDPASGQGFSLLNNAKYGFDVKGPVLRMSVIHGATAPDPEADRGGHEFVYALYPHAGSWQDAASHRRGYELNSPLIVRTGMLHAGSLPAENAFVKVEPPGVVLTAFKIAMGYDSRDIIIRLVETFGSKTGAVVTFPWPVQAAETDLIERPLKAGLVLDSAGAGNTVTVPLGPYEIRTFRVVRKK